MSDGVRESSPLSRLTSLFSRLSRTRAFVRIGRRVFHRIDGVVFRLSGGRAIASDLVMPVAMLTTTGRRSGLPRTVPIAAIPDGEDWLVVGSNFGQAQHPAWVRNIQADPRAVVRRRGRETPVEAVELDEQQRQEVWPLLTSYWPPFDDYVDRADASGRDIRVFRLRPCARAAPTERDGRARRRRDAPFRHRGPRWGVAAPRRPRRRPRARSRRRGR